MVGEREVLVPELDRLVRHRFDRGAAVGPVGVEVQVAGEGGVDLARPGPESGAASASSRARYSGTSPASACSMTRPLLDPTPWRLWMRPCSASSRSSSTGTSRTASAARAERLFLVATGAPPLEEGRDAVECVDWIHGVEGTPPLYTCPRHRRDD